MPNTISHFAVAGVLTRSIIKTADLKWIYIGCVIPDAPWILQRLLHSLVSDIDRYDLRAYCFIQSSLFMSLVCAAALAMVSRNQSRIFLILALGIITHLLLDATQTKWANGVLVFAPFSWNVLDWGWYWPESMITNLLTLSGAMYFLYFFRSSVRENTGEFLFTIKRLSLAVTFLLLYLSLPMAWIERSYEHDHHYIATLKNTEARVGKTVEFDRNRIVISEEKPELITAFDETIKLLVDVEPDESIVSLRGEFVTENSIRVSAMHVHHPWRDSITLLGLVSVLLVWLVYSIRQLLAGRNKS